MLTTSVHCIIRLCTVLYSPVVMRAGTNMICPGICLRLSQLCWNSLTRSVINLEHRGVMRDKYGANRGVAQLAWYYCAVVVGLSAQEVLNLTVMLMN